MERWKPIAGYEGVYEVSDQGRVRRIAGGRGATPGRVLKTSLAGRYHHVTLSSSGSTTQHYVHRLVGETFHPNPEHLEHVRHLDDNADDNRAQNLAWGTPSQNQHDRSRNGGNHNANKTHCPMNHPYSDENTYVSPKGGRNCRTCRRIQMRRFR